MFINNRKNFNTSREDLLTMESEEHVYDDPEFLTKNFGSQQQSISKVNKQSNLPEHPPVIFPKKRDIVAYKVNNGKVNLHPDISHQKQWNSTRSVYPMGDGRYISRQKAGNVGASMPNVSDSGSAGTAGNRKPQRNEEYKESRKNPNSKVDSCCYCCCFFLLYMLIIAVGSVLYLLHIHVYYPHILEHQSVTNKTMESIKEDSAIMRNFLKLYCLDYYHNRTDNRALAKKKCKQLFNPNPDRLEKLLVFDSLDNPDDMEEK